MKNGDTFKYAYGSQSSVTEIERITKLLDDENFLQAGSLACKRQAWIGQQASAVHTAIRWIRVINL